MFSLAEWIDRQEVTLVLEPTAQRIQLTRDAVVDGGNLAAFYAAGGSLNRGLFTLTVKGTASLPARAMAELCT